MKLITLVILLSSSILFIGGCASSNAEPREFTVSLQVPDLAWSVHIEEIHKVNDELWVIAQLTRRPGMAGQMITTARDTVKTAAPDLPVRYFVLGKTWGWANDESYTFLSNRETISEQIKSGTRLFKRKDP